jgi:hypothetical protein
LKEIARIEAAGHILARVPQTRGDASRAVAQLQEQVEIAIPIRPELLVGYQIDIVQVVSVAKLIDISAHA